MHRWHATEDLQGKSILVHAEQGFGDTIQFARYIPLLKSRGATRVVFAVHAPLLRLLANFPGADDVIAAEGPLPECDLVCPLLSLPFEFGTTLETIPPVVRPASQAEVSSGNDGRRQRVGVVWSGRPTHVNDHNRSIPLAEFRAILDAAGEVEFFSLQKNPPDADVALMQGIPNLQNVGPQFADFSETAAFIAGLDLVITVDTAVAHLAATLGKPTWILLPTPPDFRWLLERADSPWYPSVTLFRRPPGHPWREVIAEVAARIRS